MKTCLVPLVLLLSPAISHADSVPVMTYQDIVNNEYPVNLVTGAPCFDFSFSATHPMAFDLIQVLPVPGDAKSLEVLGFLRPNVKFPTKDVVVDLTREGSFNFNPNQSGDPILRFSATGIDRQTGKLATLACGNSY